MPTVSLWDSDVFQCAALYFDQLLIESPFRLSEIVTGRIDRPDLASTPTNAALINAFNLACERFMNLYALSPMRSSGVLKLAPQLDSETDLMGMAAEYLAERTPKERANLYLNVSPSTAVSGTTLFHLQAAKYAEEHGIDARVLINQVHLLLMYARVGLAGGERATLLTNHATHARVLLSGIDSLQISDQARAALGEHKSYRELQSERLFRFLLSNELPLLRVASHADLLWLREKLSDELHAFRLEIRSLATQLRANVWEPGFEREAYDVLIAKVRPRRLRHAPLAAR